MNTVYCTKNETGSLDFYVCSSSGECYLFTQKYYRSVYEMYHTPLTIKQATDFRKADKNTILIKVIEKLPVYLRYAEKNYNYTPDKHKPRRIPIRYAARLFPVPCSSRARCMNMVRVFFILMNSFLKVYIIKLHHTKITAMREHSG